MILRGEQNPGRALLLLSFSGLISLALVRVELAGEAQVPQQPHVFDRYGDLTWEDEKARLDNFAIQLTHETDYVGYIFVFNAATMCAGEAQARAVRAKRYIVEHRDIPWNRVIWKEEGYSKEMETTLFVFRRDVAVSFHEFTFEPSHAEIHIKKNCTERIARIKRSKWN